MAAQIIGGQSKKCLPRADEFRYPDEARPMAGDFIVENDGQLSFVAPDTVARERPPLIDPIDVPLWTRNKRAWSAIT